MARTLYKFRHGVHESGAFPSLNWIMPFKAWVLDRVVSGDIDRESTKTILDISMRYVHSHVSDLQMTLTDGTEFQVTSEEEDE